MLLGTFPKAFLNGMFTSGNFPTVQFPKWKLETFQLCNFPSGNFPTVQFPKWQPPNCAISQVATFQLCNLPSGNFPSLS